MSCDDAADPNPTSWRTPTASSRPIARRRSRRPSPADRPASPPGWRRCASRSPLARGARPLARRADPGAAARRRRATGAPQRLAGVAPVPLDRGHAPARPGRRLVRSRRAARARRDADHVRAAGRVSRTCCTPPTSAVRSRSGPTRRRAWSPGSRAAWACRRTRRTSTPSASRWSAAASSPATRSPPRCSCTRTRRSSA